MAHQYMPKILHDPHKSPPPPPTPSCILNVRSLTVSQAATNIYSPNGKEIFGRVFFVSTLQIILRTTESKKLEKTT